jgi:hypothetical protein
MKMVKGYIMECIESNNYVKEYWSNDAISSSSGKESLVRP